MAPSNSSAAYLAAANAAIYQSMTAASPKALYMMQAWLFHASFWNYDRVKAFLRGVPVGKMIILDLNTEESPVWQTYDGFFGHAWIWNSLITYGWVVRGPAVVVVLGHTVASCLPLQLTVSLPPPPSICLTPPTLPLLTPAVAGGASTET